MIKQYARALPIPDSCVFLEIDDTDFLQFHVFNEHGEEHLITCEDGLWKCDCHDYKYHKDKSFGSYTCKHIIKCILFLRSHDKPSQPVLESWFE